MDAGSLEIVTKALIEFISWTDVKKIGGPAIGAVPLVSSILILSKLSLSGFFVRKEAKEYGQHDLIEGLLNPGDKVVLVEDVTTTGGSLLRTAKVVTDFGAHIKEIVTVVDREQGAKELFAREGYSFKSLLKVSELLI